MTFVFRRFSPFFLLLREVTAAASLPSAGLRQDLVPALISFDLASSKEIRDFVRHVNEKFRPFRPAEQTDQDFEISCNLDELLIAVEGEASDEELCSVVKAVQQKLMETDTRCETSISSCYTQEGNSSFSAVLAMARRMQTLAGGIVTDAEANFAETISISEESVRMEEALRATGWNRKGVETINLTGLNLVLLSSKS